MKTTKFFLMAALALTFAACSNDDNDILNPAQTAKGEGITITATLAPKSGSASMRKVTDGTDKIVAEWAEMEGIAILYTVGSTKYRTDATITSVDANGVATISFTVEDGTPDNTECTLVYPKAAAKTDKSGVKDYADMLAEQWGDLTADFDVRVGAGKIQTTTPGLDVTTQPAAQYSIFKFTTQNMSGPGITPSEFKVSDSEGNVITTVSPSSSAFYVALPALSAGTYWFSATDGSKPYIAKGTVGTATTAGNYYQSTVKMATIGDVILSDGKFAAPSSTGTKVAMIAYLGSETGVAGYTHGLALALTDKGQMSWTTATGASGAAAHTPAAPTTTSSWQLPSMDQWNKMINACKNVLGTQNNYQDLRDGFSGITGASNLQSVEYWSSTEADSYGAYPYNFGIGGVSYNTKGNVNIRVRSCLAF